MKKIKLLAISVGIVLAAFFTSCEKEEKGADITISFDNQTAKDSVYTNEECTINGTVTVDGQIKAIQFFRNYFFNDQEMEVEMAGTKISNIDENPYSFSVVVPNVIKNTNIKVLVTDINGNEVSSVYTIRERKLNIVTYSGLTLGGWNSNYGSCLDVDLGTYMSGSATTDPTMNPLIDVFFDDAKLANVDLDSVYYDNISRLSDTGIRYAKTSFTPAQFDEMRNDDSFKSLTATLPEVSIAENDVIFFLARSGKKGLLKVVSMTEPQGDLVLDEKIQK